MDGHFGLRESGFDNWSTTLIGMPARVRLDFGEAVDE